MPRLKKPADLKKLKKEAVVRRNAKKTMLAVCTGTGCRAYGAAELADTFDEEIKKRGLEDSVGVRRTGCHGFCERGPLVVIQPEDTCFLGAKPKNVPAVIDNLTKKESNVEKLLFLDEENGKRLSKLDEIPFYKYQKRILLENNVLIDPSNILDYIALGGYSALAKVLSGIDPESVLKVVTDANLRGRGGGGFPAGWKWETTRDA